MIHTFRVRPLHIAISNAIIDTTSYLAECEITGAEVNKTELAVNVGLGFVNDIKSDGGINGKNFREFGVLQTKNYHPQNQRTKKYNIQRKKAQ